jgi:hypothetical protein
VHEGDEPDVLLHLLDAHLLSRKHLADIDLAPLVAEAAAGGDDRRPVVRRILKFFQSFIRPR